MVFIERLSTDPIEIHRSFQLSSTIEAVSRLHAQEGIDITLLEGSVLDEGGNVKLDLFDTKAAGVQRANAKLVETLRDTYGEGSDEHVAASIVYELTADTNAMFRSVIANVAREPKVIRSWEDHNPEAAVRFKKRIARVTSAGGMYGRFFAKSPESRRILKIMGNQLVSESDPKRMAACINHIELLSYAAYDRGVPVIMVPSSAFYTEKDGEAKDHSLILEPDVRLILPIPRSERIWTDNMTREAWADLKELHHRIPTRTKPNPLLGVWVMGAGSQVLSPTNAERLSHGFTISVNLFKNERYVRRVLELSGQELTGDMRRYYLFLYIYHELGHYFFNLMNRTNEELETDMTANALALIRHTRYGLESQKMLAVMVGEYARQAYEKRSIHVVNDGYRRAGNAVLRPLEASGLAHYEEGILAFDTAHPTKIARACLHYLSLHDLGHMPNSRIPEAEELTPSLQALVQKIVQ